MSQHAGQRLDPNADRNSVRFFQTELQEAAEVKFPGGVP